MPQAVKCEILLYADDTCLIYTHKDVSVVQGRLNQDFNELCDWFVDNKLSIHLGKEKTKTILFSKRRNKEILEINHGDIQIVQYPKVTYLGCILDSYMSGEAMATKVMGKVNGRLKFLFRKSSFLTYTLRRMLCNALIQPHFDYAASAWYPNLTKTFAKKMQICQNKCIRFCLQKGKRHHVGFTEFETINWLPVKERFDLTVCANVHKFFNSNSPSYMAEMFIPANDTRDSRNSLFKLTKPQAKTIGQKGLSFIGPDRWNKLSSELKTIPNTNTFKHALKKQFFHKLKDKDKDIYLW
jgi:hypothetical protein